MAGPFPQSGDLGISSTEIIRRGAGLQRSKPVCFAADKQARTWSTLRRDKNALLERGK